MRERLRRALPALIGLILFFAALEVLRTELRAVTWHQLVRHVADVPSWRIGAALLLTALNYLVLTTYDLLAFSAVGVRLRLRRIMAASALAYAISNNVGLSVLSGASVRFRFYARWGVEAADILRIVFANAVTFWLGLLFLGGLSLLLSPPPQDVFTPLHPFLRPMGVLLMFVSLAYVGAAILRIGPVRIRRIEVPVAPPAIAVSQLLVSIVDWTLASAVLFVLVPPGGLSFLQFVGVFLAAQILALASHVPGGVGVFDGLVVLLTRGFVPSSEIASALIVYRAIYYLLPLCIALLALIAEELHQRRAQAMEMAATFGTLAEQITPRLLSVFTFLAGVVLLFSGATPAAAGRLAVLDSVVPLGLIEASHFLGSIAGAVLLLLSQGLARRLDAAYFFALVAIVVGILASLLKGVDIEEAAILTLVLLLLWRSRPAFDRRAALWNTRFSASWILAIIGAVGASLWLWRFAFKHVDYSNELWWQFEMYGEASRALRASVGAAVVLVLFAFARLIGHAPVEFVPPTEEELAEAGAIISTQRSTMPYLAYLRDKALLFGDDRKAFVMYGVQGGTWVALGDPVGPDERRAPLIHAFLERCDDFGGVPVFYEISKDHLHAYADVGLTFVKLGEEAKVDLEKFTLAGGAARRHRQAIQRVRNANATFRVIPVEDVPAVMPQLQAVSDNWLQQRAGGEKGFSLGSFKPDYIERFPVAVIGQQDRIVAFANVWAAADHSELSVDLMRFDQTAPKDVMESLFVHLMLWGQEQKFKWFSMGMAPLYGFESSPVAPLWNRLGTFLYEHGQRVYNFQGLRDFKQKFDPVWQPRYLAYPGGMGLPLILADVAALIAGGYRRILFK